MMQVIQRRDFLKWTGSAVGVAIWTTMLRPGLAWAGTAIQKIVKPEEEWRHMLTKEQFDVLRNEGTERPFTSPLLNEHRTGTFVCAGCDLELFETDAKFDSGTGWPSFFKAIPGNVETKTDYKIGMPRTEYHCARCGGHQGHVFNDGPQPTGLRYCNNGVALKFMPKEG
jgi:peptide-methionine (R)-S-oxide reductase